MSREEHVRQRQEAIRLKKERRERQLAFEASRKKKPKVEWYSYPVDDPLKKVEFRLGLLMEGKKIYAHNDEGYALCLE